MNYIYIWSDDLAKYSSTQILSKLDDYQGVVISDGDDDDFSERLRKIAAKKEAHLMIGQNKLFEDQTKLERKIKEDLSIPGVKGIHLDIEPWAEYKADYKINPAYYDQTYIGLITRCSAQVRKAGKPFSVSIKKNFPLTILPKIYEVCDKVFVMDYGTSKVETALRWAQEELATDKSKTVIALSRTDFLNEQQMWLNIYLMQEQGVQDICVHDFDRVVNPEKYVKLNV